MTSFACDRAAPAVALTAPAGLMDVPRSGWRLAGLMDAPGSGWRLNHLRPAHGPAGTGNPPPGPCLRARPDLTHSLFLGRPVDTGCERILEPAARRDG